MQDGFGIVHYLYLFKIHLDSHSACFPWCLRLLPQSFNDDHLVHCALDVSFIPQITSPSSLITSHLLRCTGAEKISKTSQVGDLWETLEQRHDDLKEFGLFISSELLWFRRFFVRTLYIITVSWNWTDPLDITKDIQRISLYMKVLKLPLCIKLNVVVLYFNCLRHHSSRLHHNRLYWLFGPESLAEKENVP